MKALINKYNVAGPRYTSYPTVPHWNQNGFDVKSWEASVIKSFNENNGNEISLYIHLPYCENLCTFCGCHKHITKQHSVEEPYIQTILKEWQLYLALLPKKPILKELHLGGGTPTFFHPKQLTLLITEVLETVVKHQNLELSIEGHPNNTSEEHLITLYNIGFRRVSFGVQDYDEKVQKAINRIQPFEQVQKSHSCARHIGFASISHDLVYGLPFQTPAAMANTIKLTCSMRPDRISLYGYAHVPWIKGVGQRGFNETDIPSGNEKRMLYELAKEKLVEAGYVEIGMDHFALQSDNLFQAQQAGNLHRNFMGYTTNKTQILIGLGMSAISDSKYMFSQNEKSVKAYFKQIESGNIAGLKGHKLNSLDLEIRQYILDIMCRFKTKLPVNFYSTAYGKQVLANLDELVMDNIVSIDGSELTVTELGKVFVRNVCMCFDDYLNSYETTQKVFSSTI